MSSAKATKSQYLSGRDIAIQLKEISLFVCSPEARSMLWEAEAGDFLDEDWIIIAILNQLIDDTLTTLHTRSHIVTIEKMLSAIMKGEYKDKKEEILSDDEEDEISDSE